MEKLDLYDLNKIRTEKTIIRGEEVPKNYYRLVVHACIFNDEGKMLIQKRAACKKFWPNMWDVSVGGCVTSGETSGLAITRETKEELGIDIDFTNIRPALSFSFSEGYDDIYIINKNIDLSKIVLQKEEVAEVKYASLEEINKMVKDGSFIAFQDHFIEFLFEMNGKTDVFKS